MRADKLTTLLQQALADAQSLANAADHPYIEAAHLLKALLHPGGLPPFPRLAINRRVAAAGGIPTEVSLEIDSRMNVVTGRAECLRCVHKFHPRLLAGDLDRIDDAESRVAVASQVPLAEFAAAPTAGGD